MTTPTPKEHANMTTSYFLSHGSHKTADEGRCAMEWVSFLAGEPHSDSPKCVSPVLSRFCIRLNDRLGDDDRQKLRPYLARTIGTKGDGLDEQRVQMCREFLVHYALPIHLGRAGRTEAAARLRALPDVLTVEETLAALHMARDEARSARTEAVGRLTKKIRAELAKRGFADADAAADADADAVAAAVAAAAADAAAAAAAVADAAAAAAAVAAAAAAAAAVADAVAAAVAAAAAVADADKPYSDAWYEIRSRVYDAVYAKAKERAQEVNAEMLPAALILLDRILPTEVIQLPTVSEWREVCGLAS